jgi:hypothetical protein
MYIRFLKLEETKEDSVFLWGARQTSRRIPLLPVAKIGKSLKQPFTTNYY